MLLCTRQNILVFRSGIKLAMTLSGILMVDFTPALNRILTHTLTPPQR
jgi:hypothetical protein